MGSIVKWDRTCFFSNFLLFGIMCVGYFITIFEQDWIKLWILELGICRSWRCLVVIVWTVPHIPTMIIMGGSNVHPNWDRSERRAMYLSSFWCVASTSNQSLQ